MLPKIAIVGRPNVGKSALFNRICQKRISIVDEEEGITRDRLYATAEMFGRSFVLIDTGGIDLAGKIPFAEEVQIQAEVAILEADVILLVVDGRVGVTTFDDELAKRLKRGGKPVIVAVNKTDSGQEEGNVDLFQGLGFPHVVGVSALQGYQIAELVEMALDLIGSEERAVEESAADGAIKVAIVGRPNVGKSTLLNHLLNEERSIVSPIAGTTRDALDALLMHDNQEYLLIDTAGIRRKKAEKEVVDKFAAIRTEEAIERCDVCLLILDSFEGLTIQERRIASHIESLGKSCILLFNKWDLMKNFRMEHALRGIREAVPFLAHCPTLFISATEKRNLHKILPMVRDVYKNRFLRIGTGELNKFIEACLQKYHPPLITGKRLRIYYLTQVETNPPKFVLFVNKPNLLTDTYKKYLINRMRTVFPFSGTPLLFELRARSHAPVAS